jgi:hypothetical protein
MCITASQPAANRVKIMLRAKKVAAEDGDSIVEMLGRRRGVGGSACGWVGMEYMKMELELLCKRQDTCTLAASVAPLRRRVSKPP